MISIIALGGVLTQFFLGNSTDSRSQAASNPPTQGWDSGMKKRCVTSPEAGKTNGFALKSDCGKDNKRWTLAVQSEKEYGGTCVGITNQSFSITNLNTFSPQTAGKKSPITFNWLPRQTAAGLGYSFNLKSDFLSSPHPCGKGAFTWYALMDHSQLGGGLHLPPNQLKHSFIASYNDYTPNGASRMFSAIQFILEGKTYQIEMNHVLTNWGDNYPQNPKIIQIDQNPERTYIALDAAAFGLTLPKAKDQLIKVQWDRVINQLIQDRTIPQPKTWNGSSTTALYVGEETKSMSDGNSVIGDLWITDWKESAN